MASCTIFMLGILCLFGLVSCQVVTMGSCPEVNVQENFDLDRYLGKWYQNRAYMALFSSFASCVTAEYSKLSETSVQVNNSGYLYLSEKTDIAIGEAAVIDGAKLGVRFSDAAPYGKYWVLSTDYTSYSIVWSCDETPEGAITFNSQYLWILTRDRDGVSEAEMDKILQILKGYGINTDIHKLKITKQENCALKRKVQM